MAAGSGLEITASHTEWMDLMQDMKKKLIEPQEKVMSCYEEYLAVCIASGYSLYAPSWTDW
jgi:hypothetical protein